MNVDQLTSTTGEWLRGVGAHSDVVVSSRVRLARNLDGFPFLSMATGSQRTEIFRALSGTIISNPSWKKDAIFIDLAQTDQIDRRLLVERHLISRQHAAGEGARGVGVSANETLAMMVNEEDHLRIQALRSGFQLDELWQQVSKVDDQLSAKHAFAFDRQFGYLTACPTNVGTGIRVSVMLHLPALKLTKEIDKFARAARDTRLAVRGLFGEGTDAVGDLYQVSNQTTLGKAEEEIIASFGTGIIPKIVDYERTARQSLIKHRPYQLDDKIWRAYGILRNARCISSEETNVLLSPLRLGIHTGRFQEIDLEKLNELFLYTQPAHIQKICCKHVEGEERGIVRADYIRKRLAVADAR